MTNQGFAQRPTSQSGQKTLLFILRYYVCFKEHFRFEKLTLKIDLLTIIDKNCFTIVGVTIY